MIQLKSSFVKTPLFGEGLLPGFTSGTLAITTDSGFSGSSLQPPSSGSTRSITTALHVGPATLTPTFPSKPTAFGAGGGGAGIVLSLGATARSSATMGSDLNVAAAERGFGERPRPGQMTMDLKSVPRQSYGKGASGGRSGGGARRSPQRLQQPLGRFVPAWPATDVELGSGRGHAAFGPAVITAPPQPKAALLPSNVATSHPTPLHHPQPPYKLSDVLAMSSGQQDSNGHLGEEAAGGISAAGVAPSLGATTAAAQPQVLWGQQVGGNALGLQHLSILSNPGLAAAVGLGGGQGLLLSAPLGEVLGGGIPGGSLPLLNLGDGSVLGLLAGRQQQAELYAQLRNSVLSRVLGDSAMQQQQQQQHQQQQQQQQQQVQQQQQQVLSGDGRVSGGLQWWSSGGPHQQDPQLQEQFQRQEVAETAGRMGAGGGVMLLQKFGGGRSRAELAEKGIWEQARAEGRHGGDGAARDERQSKAGATQGAEGGVTRHVRPRRHSDEKQAGGWSDVSAEGEWEVTPVPEGEDPLAQLAAARAHAKRTRREVKAIGAPVVKRVLRALGIPELWEVRDENDEEGPWQERMVKRRRQGGQGQQEQGPSDHVAGAAGGQVQTGAGPAANGGSSAEAKPNIINGVATGVVPRLPIVAKNRRKATPVRAAH